jgi:hypothetical protein
MKPQNGRGAAFFAFYLLTLGAAYLAGITFLEIPEGSREWVPTILGFVLGTALAGSIGYMIGTSDSSRAKNSHQNPKEGEPE